MAEYLRPGVFVEEIPSGSYPIEGVGTSAGAFIGVADRGAINTPRLITNWAQFVKHFGSYRSDSYLAYAVYGFFLNGGRRCYVSRVADDDAVIASVTLKDRESETPVDTLKIQALNEGAWGNDLTIDIEAGTLDATNEFKIVVKEGAVVLESWDNLSMIDADANFVESVINGNSNYIQVSDQDSETTAPDDQPAVQAATALISGADGTAPVDADYVGVIATKTGFYAFDDVDDINILAAPGQVADTVVQGGLTYCEAREDVIYIADITAAATPAEAKTFREQFDSSYGACYYPQIKINDLRTGTVNFIPNSGYIAGVFARSDGERGVHKAPANEIVRGAIGLEYEITAGEQEVLNPAGVNCIRTFVGRGIRIWGARTMSSDSNLRYVHKRRTLMFIEESIGEAMAWAVFEPNDTVLWGKIIRSCNAFLKRQWMEGALFGNTEAEAYYVKCDEETNPADVRAAGQVVTEIGVNIVETAEFVIFRIGIWDGGTSITE